MDKARLPDVPSILKERSYKPSGKVSPVRFIFVLIVGIVLAPIIAMIGFFVANFLLGLVVALVNFASRVRLSALLFGAIILFTSAIWVGLIVGWMLSGLLRFAKCRSSLWAGIAGLVVFGAAFAVMLTRQGRTIVILPLIAPGFFGWLDVEGNVLFLMNGIPIPFNEDFNWVDALYAVEGFIAVMLLGVGTAFTPFCEHCKRWYKAEQSVKLPMANTQKLIDSLTEQTLRLSSDDIYPLTNYPHLRVDLHYCDTCNVSDVELTAQIVEEGARGKPKTDKWFSTMVKARRANALLRTLIGKERPSNSNR
jgi:hypothetical protein